MCMPLLWVYRSLGACSVALWSTVGMLIASGRLRPYHGTVTDDQNPKHDLVNLWWYRRLGTLSVLWR